jgi:hypothetical protein
MQSHVHAGFGRFPRSSLEPTHLSTGRRAEFHRLNRRAALTDLAFSRLIDSSFQLTFVVSGGTAAMPEKHRKPTQRGMGAVLESGLVPRSKSTAPTSGVSTKDEARPLAFRDTVLDLEMPLATDRQSGAAPRRPSDPATKRPPIPRTDPVSMPPPPDSIRLGLKPRPRAQKDLATAPLDAREAFLLSLVDGRMTVQDIVDAAAMPKAEAIAILQRLVRLDLVEL